MLQLFTHYRSISAHRVRIALNYKEVSFKSIFIDLGHSKEDIDNYQRVNPQGLIPALLVEDGSVITQSAAILEYLEERYAQNALLPEDTLLRGKIRSFAQITVADTHPLNNLRVFRYLRDGMQVDIEKRKQWLHHWSHKALEPMESIINANFEEHGESKYCFGNTPTLADVCMVPQLMFAQRYGVDLRAYPTLRRIYQTCETLGAFQAAAPGTQPDSRIA